MKTDGKMNVACFQKILAEKLHSAARKLRNGRSLTFQHDNDDKHKTIVDPPVVTAENGEGPGVAITVS